MARTRRSTARTQGTVVEDLNVPAWLMEEAVASHKPIPKDAVTVEMYSKVINRGLPAAYTRLSQRVESGELDWAYDGRRKWYWPKGAA